jgi:transposase InsO family protein
MGNAPAPDLNVELSVMEQRYHAVMEALSGGVPIVEVAERYGVSRKSVHARIRRYRDGGMPALADRSHRPHSQPKQLAGEIEAKVCELRRAHPRWGPRRLVHELRRAGISPVPSRSTVYPVLVRHKLVSATTRKRRRNDYTRWERLAPMQLWQLDIMGSVMINDPTAPGGVREAKLISGIDDFSRYCVIAKLVPRATSRAVCSAFAIALGEYGVPDQVLTDNGMQFTGKYMRPRPTEVLFDRICRHNGINHLLTKIQSPTTTGKIERFHQTIQTELLDPTASRRRRPTWIGGGPSTTPTGRTRPATWTPPRPTSPRSRRANAPPCSCGYHRSWLSRGSPGPAG